MAANMPPNGAFSPGAETSRVHLILKHSKAGLAGRRELPVVVTRLAVSRKTAPSRSSEPC